MISLLLMMVAGALNAVMDRISFTFKSSVFKDLNPVFWDVKTSWKNMWKWPLEPFSGWYYFGLYKPRYKEKFPYSTTFLVWATDAWHLAKALMIGCIGLAIGFHSPVVNWFVDALVMVTMFGVMFTYFYDYILKSKK
jgi:hypothetical protein